MKESDVFPTQMGKIVGNLQSLEFLLRLFLYDLDDPQNPDLQLEKLNVGDVVQENPLTNYDSLGTLIDKVNARLEDHEQSDRIDRSLVELRDAFAHGRISSDHPEGVYHLLKFSQASNGNVRVTDSIHLTSSWMAEQISRTRYNMLKVMRLGHNLNLNGFSTPDPIHSVERGRES